MNILYNKGLVLSTEFINISEELEIESHIPKTPKINQNTRNSIKRYGSNTPYKNQIESTTIPRYLDRLSAKIVERGLLSLKPNSISINEYLPGNSIAPHIDSLESGQIITIISLLSDAVMVFSRNKEQHKIIIPSRSIIQLKNEIRFEWKHSIEPVKLKRYSIVFRNG